MEGAASETKWGEQGLIREQAKGVELFPMANGGPLKESMWQVYVSGDSSTSDTNRQTRSGERLGYSAHLPHERGRT